LRIKAVPIVVPNRAIGDNRDLHVPRKVHNALHERRSKPGTESAHPFPCDEDLRHPVEPGEVNDRLGHARSFQNACLDAKPACEIQMTFERFTFFGPKIPKIGLFRHVHGETVGPKVVGDATAAPDQGGA
jgi:hypothetical protein